MGVREGILLMQVVLTCPERFAERSLENIKGIWSGDYPLGLSAFLRYCAFCFCLKFPPLLEARVCPCLRGDWRSY